MNIDFDRLRAPFPADRISWRVGATNREKTKGLALAFIDARDVMERLDDVCSPAGWQDRYPHANGKTVCAIGIKIGDEWIWKEDGAGDTDVEAEKGALSDAFKRAAVRWGIGRYLYDVASPWVDIEPHGKSYGIKASELPKLRAVLGGKPLPKPEPAKPEPKGLVLKVSGKPDQTFTDEKAWFDALQKAVADSHVNWTPNRPTVLKLAAEAEEWKARAKSIGAMVAPAAA